MTRIARQVIDGAPHHVVLRGNNRRRLFSYPRDYLRFTSLLVTATQRTACQVNALCLMANHVHLLVTPTDKAAMADFVKHVAQCYAQHWNRERDSSGKLFEERYNCIAMRNERHVAIATAYIDLNPVRAGITSNPAAYRWSSCAHHLGKPAEPWMLRLWSPTNWYLGLAHNAAYRGSLYESWLNEYQRHIDLREQAIALDPLQSSTSQRLERPNRKRAY